LVLTMNIKKLERGQILLEVLVSITLSGVFIIATTLAFSSLLFLNYNNRNMETAINLGNDLMDSVVAVADADWHNIYSLTKASSTHYYINNATSPFLISSGEEVVSVGGISFTRYFYVDNVTRNSNGYIASTSGVVDDPSTQKITMVVTWPRATAGISFSKYVTRYKNSVFVQTDWSGGKDQELFPKTFDRTLVNNLFASSSNVLTSTQGELSLTALSGELTSSVYDTLVTQGVAINSIMWQGTQPAGATVKFQVASSNNSIGPWSYLGADGTNVTYYTITGPDTPVKISRADHNNKRYMRYRVFLGATSVPATPIVTDIIMNWSR